MDLGMAGWDGDPRRTQGIGWGIRGGCLRSLSILGISHSPQNSQVLDDIKNNPRINCASNLTLKCFINLILT